MVSEEITDQAFKDYQRNLKDFRDHRMIVSDERGLICAELDCPCGGDDIVIVRIGSSFTFPELREDIHVHRDRVAAKMKGMRSDCD